MDSKIKVMKIKEWLQEQRKWQEVKKWVDKAMKEIRLDIDIEYCKRNNIKF